MLIITIYEASKNHRTKYRFLFPSIYDSRFIMSPILPEDLGPKESTVSKQCNREIHWFSPATPKLSFQKLSFRYK